MKSQIKYLTALAFAISSINVGISTPAYAKFKNSASSARTIIPLPSPENCALYYTAYCAGRDVSKLGKLSPLRIFCELCSEEL
jgi:hypothetical protein